MNSNKSDFVNKVFQHTLDRDITWSVADYLPPVLEAYSICIVSCFVSSSLDQGTGNLYLYKFTTHAYSEEFEQSYRTEKIIMSYVKYNQIVWETDINMTSLYNLYNYISDQFSGINDIFKF